MREVRDVYEVVSRKGGRKFSWGFCFGFVEHGPYWELFEPFGRAVLFVPFGELPCREPVKGRTRLLRSDYLLVPVPWQPWMDFEAADINSAVELCVECSEPLPRGFRRV